MKVLILYRPKSEEDTPTTDFKHDFERQTGQTIEVMDRDTIQGLNLANLYGVMDFPAVVATDDSGALQQAWQGRMMPLINDVLYYKMQ